MNHLTVGLDVDDVLLPSQSHTLRWYNERFDTALTGDHWYNFSSLDPWKVESELQIHERVNDILNSEDYLSEIVPMEGALEVLDELDANGDRKIGITSRPPILKEMTYRVLDLCYPGMFPEGSIVFTGYSSANASNERIPKVEIALAMGVTHHVDDVTEHLRPMAAVGIKPYLFDRYPWNSDAEIPGLERVANWKELGDRLEYERIK